MANNPGTPERSGRPGAFALLTWLAAAAAPPAVSGSIWNQFVAHHVFLAIAIAVAYWIVAAVVGFFSMIAKDVSSRWQKRIADRVDLFLQRKGPRFERAYREFVLAGLKYIDQKGLAIIGPFTPELDEVFVDVIVDPRSLPRTEPGVLTGSAKGPPDRHTLETFLGQQKPAVLAVVGGPGSGKTTLLRHTAQQASRRTRLAHNLGRDLPVLLYLRDHAEAITADHSISISALVRTKLGDLRAEEPDGWLEQQLRNGRCLVLLDGLDEVARREDRIAVAAWAERQIQQYPGNDFVISSRPQGYQAAPVEGAKILQVCGFTPAQAETLVHGWYRAVERISTGAEGPDIDARANEGAADLLRRLELTPALRDLTANPLLLTMMANVHRYRAALPGSRADLYSEICQAMLWRRQEAKNLASQIPGDKKESILRGLAYTMMERRISDLGREKVLAVIRPDLRRVARDADPEDFLTDVSSNGLLIERETEQYAFAHHTFQEYLAAVHIRAKNMVSVLVDAVNDDWWRETTLLYAARGDTDLIVRACLEADTISALALSFDCDEQGSEFAPDLRDRLHDLMNSALAPDCNDERRRLIVGAVLTRHLRDQYRTASGTRICIHPITKQIYRFFRADQENPHSGAPAGETSSGLLVGHGNPEALVQWTNTISGAQTAYRLPRETELDDLVTRQDAMPSSYPGLIYAVWAQPDIPEKASSARIWVPPDHGEPRLINAATLSARVTSDLTDLTDSFVVQVQIEFLLLHSLFSVYGLVRDLPRDLAREIAFPRARDRDLALDRDLDRDLALALDRARALNRAHARSAPLDLALDLALGLAGDRVIDLALALNRALDLVSALTGALDRARQLARALAPDLASILAPDLTSDLASGLALAHHHALSQVMGHTLSKAIGNALRSSESPDDWATKFASALAETAGIGDAWAFTTDPGTLGETLALAVEMLLDVLPGPSPDSAGMASWAETVATRLLNNARPVFDGRERPGGDMMTAIRLAALCLAGEADGLDRMDIGEMFRQVAAGITVLEMANAGENPVIDVIMLAAD